MEANPKLNIRGLRLPPPTVKRLGETGIFARPEVSLEYQSLTKRYVVRGVESGGAVTDLGRYVTFAGESGEQLSWLQPIDSLAVNGVHAVVVAPVFTRVEMFRMGRTYELVITKHRPSAVQNGSRPKLLADIPWCQWVPGPRTLGKGQGTRRNGAAAILHSRRRRDRDTDGVRLRCKGPHCRGQLDWLHKFVLLDRADCNGHRTGGWERRPYTGAHAGDGRDIRVKSGATSAVGYRNGLISHWAG